MQDTENLHLRNFIRHFKDGKGKKRQPVDRIAREEAILCYRKPRSPQICTYFTEMQSLQHTPTRVDIRGKLRERFTRDIFTSIPTRQIETSLVMPQRYTTTNCMPLIFICSKDGPAGSEFRQRVDYPFQAAASQDQRLPCTETKVCVYWVCDEICMGLFRHVVLD